MKKFAPEFGWQLFYFDAFAGSGSIGKDTQLPSVSASTSIFLDELADTDWAGMEKRKHIKGRQKGLSALILMDLALIIITSLTKIRNR